MTTNVLRAPQTIGFGARRLMYLVIGLMALALVAAALTLSGTNSSSTSGTAVRTDNAPNEAAVGVAIGRTFAPVDPSGAMGAPDDVPAGSGVALGRTPYYVPQPNLLPK